MTDFSWLPPADNWRQALKTAEMLADPLAKWSALASLANARIDYLQTSMLDRVLQRSFGTAPPPGLQARPIRLAFLSSSTTHHLIPSLRVAALRRGMWLAVHVSEYGQVAQALMDPTDELRAFKPDVVLLAIDARSCVGAVVGQSPEAVDTKVLWEAASALGASLVVQQTILPVFPRLSGSQEFRFEASPATRVAKANARFRNESTGNGVVILDLDHQIARDGLNSWHDASLWHSSKQEVRPSAAPMYGELAGRLLGATFGLSAKVAVLDLDNTLWGGVIGDDGLQGITIGQGSGLGEAFSDFQSYLKNLSRRGVLLAVCSKNDQANARAPFEDHPDMVLRMDDIACFVANWDDKPGNLRRIAAELNVGLDSLVFVDDNPFERNLVRRELPMVRTPEMPDDPASYASCLADAGYFEALVMTEEDSSRSSLYQGNIRREALRNSATDIAGYLRDLNLRLSWRPFDTLGMGRIEQLVNKTNQFNLTTARRTRAELEAISQEHGVLTMQVRLADVFGDNGMISVVIAIPSPGNPGVLRIDTWLMSCRVIGRQVEDAVMNILCEECKRRGVSSLIGEYRETPKNAMVRDHYSRLGFKLAEQAEGVQLWRLNVNDFVPFDTHIHVEAGGQ